MLNIKHTPIKMLYFTYQPKCMWLASHIYSYTVSEDSYSNSVSGNTE